MDGSQGGSGGPAPFLTKTYEMVDDRSTNSIVSWSQNGHSFVVWNPPEFAQELLPKYFKHNNFSSFVRQLNTYGFRKIDPDQWEFANEEFIRGQIHLLKNIHRRKPIHSHSVHNQGSSVPLTDSERQEFEEEIQRLKHGKSVLQLELQRHNQEKQNFDIQVRSLGERVWTMEHRQRQIMAFLAQELQKPRFASGLMQNLEAHNKKRRLLISNCLYGEAIMGENQIGIFQTENADATSVRVLNLELIENLDSSLDFWENTLNGFGRTSSEEMLDFGVLPQPSPITISEIRASSRDCDVDLQLSSPDSMDVHSSPELAGSSSHMDSPVISSICLNLDVRSKSSGINVYSKPLNVTDVNSLKEQVERTMEPPPPRTGVNDLFWEQFLTETPCSSETQEVQSANREIDARKIEIKPGEHRKYWLNMNNVDNITEQMGHLSPAERT